MPSVLPALDRQRLGAPAQHAAGQVGHLRVAGLLQQLRGLCRACAGTADRDDRPRVVQFGQARRQLRQRQQPRAGNVAERVGELGCLAHVDDLDALAAAFRRTGGRTGVLSNSGPEMMARVRARRPLEALFDAVIISCEVGLSKPDPRIYQLSLDRLGLPAPEALFVDDRADNIEGAARVGLRTLRFEGLDALARLRALVA